MQPVDHFQAQPALTVQHFRDPATAAKKGLQIAWRQPLLLHTKLDSFDGFRWPAGEFPHAETADQGGESGRRGGR